METQLLTEVIQKLDLGNVTLNLSSKAQEVRRSLDVFYSKYGVETIGIGLTRIVDSELMVEDILTPNPEVTLILETGIIEGSFEKLTNFLLDSQGEVTLNYDFANNVLRCEASGEDIELKGLSKNLLIKLLSFLGEQEFQLDKDINIQLEECPLEVVFYGWRVMASGRFRKRILKEATSRNLQTGYMIHHHPIPFLLRLAAQTNLPAANEKIYEEVLKVSDSDIRAAQTFGVRVLEIRALGTTINIMSDEVLTSRFYEIPQRSVDSTNS